MRSLFFLSALVLGLSCVTQRATAWEVPKERASECEKICIDLGMRLSAVVVIMSAAGCVCEPANKLGQQSGGAGGTAGGAIMVQAAAAAAQASQMSAQQNVYRR